MPLFRQRFFILKAHKKDFMKRLLLIFTILLAGISQAQQTNKAQKLLDKVYQKMSEPQNLWASFKHILENTEQGVRQETQGEVTTENNKYLLNYMGATILFDGKLIHTIIPENEEVTIEQAQNKKHGSVNPSEIFSFYKQGYNYKWDIQQNTNGKKIQYIELTPIKTDSEVKKILLGIDIATSFIYKIIEIGKNNTQTTITINELKINQKLPENLFIFNEKQYKEQGYHILKY